MTTTPDDIPLNEPAAHTASLSDAAPSASERMLADFFATDAEAPAADDYDFRFGGIRRLYGASAFAHFRHAHVAVVGVGGVGSWSAEALARSGIGEMSSTTRSTSCGRSSRSRRSSRTGRRRASGPAS